MLAAVAAAALCAGTPVHGEPLPQSGSLEGMRWVQARPNRAGIVGMLFAFDPRLGKDTFAIWTHGVAPEGWNTKILWIVRNVHAGFSITVRGRDLAGATTFRQRFEHAVHARGDTEPGMYYPSIVEIPYAGCWRLDVSSGGARATLVVRAVDA